MSIVPTPEQAAIIAHPLEPLRVAAGAGTGKTTTIALRLAAAVRRDDVEPEHALGVTFTNKAAEELADRLRAELEEFAAESREVEVTTYHGFAYQILSEFGPLLGLERDLTVIGPAHVRRLLRDALASTPISELDLTSPARRVSEMLTLANRLGDHLRAPTDLLDLPGDDETTAKRRAMAAVLVRYERIKNELGVLDYSDLIRRAYEAVAIGGVAERVRNRYRIVLLDEYQDTNPAQRELLLRVFGNGFPVTAVGDPDQTIYEWRGASRANFSSFPRHFPKADGSPAPTLPLGLNRRSDRLIIDVANLVRGRIDDDPDRPALLEPRPQAGTGFVQTSWFRTSVDEAAWIAAEIRRLHDEDELPWSEMAVVFRKNRSMHLVREALDRADVPVEVVALGGLLGVPEVADLRAWLTIIARPDDDPSLLRILLGSRYRLGLADLLPLTHEARRGGVSLLETIERIDDVTGLSEEARRRVSSFRSDYRSLLVSAQASALLDVCLSILSSTGAWAELEALDDARRLSTRLNLYRFLDLAERWSPLEGAPSLDAFLEYLDLLMEDGGSDELDSAVLSGEDAVSLITAHRAKGLEWSVVFLPVVCAGVFPSQPHGGLDDPAAYAHSVPFDLRLDGTDGGADTIKRAHVSQEWRTAYVAVTRAKHRLYVSGAHWYTTGRPKKPSDLFEVIANAAGVLRGPFVDDPGLPPETLMFDVHVPAPDPVFTDGWGGTFARASEDPAAFFAAAADAEAFEAHRTQLRLLLDGLPGEPVLPEPSTPLRVSVTGLVTYATCPKRYFWTSVDPLPRRPSPAARRGVEVHRRIELHNLGAVPLTEPGGYDHVVETAGRATSPFSSFLDSVYARTQPVYVELPFELVGKARIRGRIDAIYAHTPDEWEVVDFKSGSRSSNPATIVQLEAYALAVTDPSIVPSPPERLTASFVYLGGGLDVVTESVDPVWLEGARRHVDGLIEGIESERFGPTPSEGCRWCDFVQFCPEGRTFLADAASG